MFDFLDSFFKSNIAKNNVIGIMIIVTISIVIGALLMWLYMSKIQFRMQTNEIEHLKDLLRQKDEKIFELDKQLATVRQKLDELMRSSEELAFFHQCRTSADESDPAITDFIHD